MEAHSAPSSASSGDQTPLQAGSRGCCPTATWGLPTRLHKCISQPQAGRGITCRQASFKTIFLVVSGARGQSLGWKGCLGTREEPQLPALTLPYILCDLNKGVSSLGLSFPAYGARGLRAASRKCGLWSPSAPRPPCRHTPPTPAPAWTSLENECLPSSLLFPEGAELQVAFPLRPSRASVQPAQAHPLQL